MSSDALPLLSTRVGRALWDEHLLYGKRLYRDLVSGGLLAVVPLLVGGRTLTPDDLDLFSRFCVCTLITDPHIWPLKVVRLGASYGGMLPGMACGALVQDSERIGAAPTAQAATWLLELARDVGENPDDIALHAWLEAAVASRSLLPGFGVPFRDTDERVAAIRQLVAGSHAVERPYWSLFERTSAWVTQRKGIAPNLGSAAAALLLDMGFTPEETGRVIVFLVMLMQFANAVEGADQAPALLQTLPAHVVSYEGPGPRVSSRAQALLVHDRDGPEGDNSTGA